MPNFNMVNASLTYCTNFPASTGITDTFTSSNYTLTGGTGTSAWLITTDGTTTQFISLNYPPNDVYILGSYSNSGTSFTRTVWTAPGASTNRVVNATISAVQWRFMVAVNNTGYTSTSAFCSTTGTTVGGNPTITAGSGVTTAAFNTLSTTAPNVSFQAVVYPAIIDTTTASNAFTIQRMNQCQGANPRTAALPTTSAVGDMIWITNSDTTGTNRYRITQAAGQYIRVGSSVSTTGTGGYIQSNGANVSAELVCIAANTGWAVIGSSSSSGFTVV